MGATKELAAFCTQLTYARLPMETVDQAKYLFLDFLGVGAGGSRTESSKVMLDFVQGFSAKGNAVVIASNYSTAPQYAALANGTFAHSLELDDVNNEASLHPAVAVIPAALSAAQMSGCSGEDFLAAVVIGYEVMVRLGKALGPAKHYAQGFHPTGTCGVFGAAAAAGKILNLNEAQLTSAFGIAGSQTAGSMEFLSDGAWTKRLHPGWAAHSGLLAVLLARKGFRGPATIFEGKSGFLQAYSPEPDYAKLTEGLGQSYQIMRTSIKPHACCRYKQAPIDGILQLVDKYNLNTDDIKQITLGMLEVSFPIVVDPPELKYKPKSVVDAQFSMPFGAAVAVLRRKAMLEEYSQQFIDSPAVRDLMQKVICVRDPELDKTYPKQWRARVTIETMDGQIYQTLIDYPKGDPENPLTWEELIDKFCIVTNGIFAPEKQEEIVETVRLLDDAKDLEKLCSLVS